MRSDDTRVRCLILSHAFNMDGRAASHTITDKVPHLLERGWQLFVLSAITGLRDERFPHLRLIAFGPSAFRFDFRHWFAARFGRGWLYRLATSLVTLALLPFIAVERLVARLPGQWSWALSATLAGTWWIRKHRINLIYSTGGSWSAHLAGWWLHRLTGIKWIVEFHDPMVDRKGPDDPGNSMRSTREARLRQKLETVACRDAHGVWWFTQGALHHARVRNPGMGDRGFFVWPGAEAPENSLAYRKGSQLNIAHFGSLASNRSLAELIKVLPTLYERIPQLRAALRIHVYGSDLDPLSRQVIDECQLQDVILSHGRLERDPETHLSGRDRVFQIMQTSDFLLLLHGDHEGCAEYIPSKIYEYWWAHRPILAITHRNPELAGLVDRINASWQLRAEAMNGQSILRMLENAWELWNSSEIGQFRPPPPLSVAEAVDRIVAQVDPVGMMRPAGTEVANA